MASGTHNLRVGALTAESSLTVWCATLYRESSKGTMAFMPTYQTDDSTPHINRKLSDISMLIMYSQCRMRALIYIIPGYFKNFTIPQISQRDAKELSDFNTGAIINSINASKNYVDMIGISGDIM